MGQPYLLTKGVIESFTGGTQSFFTNINLIIPWPILSEHFINWRKGAQTVVSIALSNITE